MKAYGGSGRIPPQFLSSAQLQVSCQLHSLAAFPARKELLLPIEQVARWAGRFGEMVNLSFPEIELRLLSCPTCTLVIVPTELGQ